MKMPHPAAVVASLILGLGLAGCSSPAAPTGSAEEPLDPAAYLSNPPEPGTEVWVMGALWEDDTTLMLCDAMLESYPPQCSSGVDLGGLPGTWWEDESGLTRWTNRAYTLHGRVQEDGSIEVLELLGPAT